MIIDYSFKCERMGMVGDIIITGIMKVDELMNRVDLKLHDLDAGDLSAVMAKCKGDILNTVKGKK